MIELSVHLITFNSEKYIESTIQSILKQKITFTYEIVVGDDCSTDNTLNIINKYALKHPKLFKIKKNDSQLGILKNFKTTLDRCSGNFVFDIAGDDLFKTDDALEKMVTALKNDSSLGFVDSGFDQLDIHKGITIPFVNKNKLNTSKKVYKQNIILGKIPPIGICYNKKLLYKYVDFETYLNKNITIEDYPILVDLGLQTNFSCINESLHIYRIHDKSFTHQKSFEELVFQKTQIKTLFNYFSKKFNFSNKITNQFLQNHYKELLFLAGYFHDKSIGKSSFKELKNKQLKDYIHYWASQSKAFRELISLRKKLFK